MKTRFYFCYLTAMTTAAIGLAVSLPSASNMAQEPDGPPLGGEANLPNLPSVESADADPARRELQDATIARDRSRNDDAVQSNNRVRQQEAEMRDAEKRYSEDSYEYPNQVENYRRSEQHFDDGRNVNDRRFQDGPERFPANFIAKQFIPQNLFNGPNNGPPVSPEMEKIRFKLLELSIDLKNAESDERKAEINTEIQSQLTELKSELNAQYDVYLEQHEAPLKELESRLEKLRTEFEWRKTAKEGLVKLRVETIYYESQGLGWPGGQPNQGPDVGRFDDNLGLPRQPQSTKRLTNTGPDGVSFPRRDHTIVNPPRYNPPNQTDSPPSRPANSDGGR